MSAPGASEIVRTAVTYEAIAPRTRAAGRDMEASHGREMTGQLHEVEAGLAVGAGSVCGAA